MLSDSEQDLNLACVYGDCLLALKSPVETDKEKPAARALVSGRTAVNAHWILPLPTVPISLLESSV